MATTLAKIRERALALSGYSDDDSRMPTGDLTVLINNAVHRVTSHRDWPWLEAVETFETVPRQRAYDTPAGWSRTLRLAREESDYDMTLISARNIQTYERRGRTSVAYYVERAKLWVVPTPEEAFNLIHVYYKDEATLANESDELALPERFMDAVVCHTLQQMATRFDDDGLFAKAFAQGQKAMERMEDEALRTVGTGRVTTRSDWALV